MENKKQIAVVHMDDAYYLGANDTGVYFDSGRGRDGWYVSTVYDIPHDCGDMTTDDGPYPTEGDALLAGLNQAVETLLSNEVYRGYRMDENKMRRQFERMRKG